MRLFIEDAHEFPDAEPADLQRCFDEFDAVTKRYADLVDEVSDLDMGATLASRMLYLTGFIDRADGEWPRYYVAEARGLMNRIAGVFMFECGVPRSLVNRKLQVTAADGSFQVVEELTFTVPAPAGVA